MELNPKIKDSLIKMNFISRYEELSNSYNSERTPSENRLIYIDGKEVMDMIEERGYIPKFDSKEKFYKIQEEHVDKYTFTVHYILRDGMVDIVWVVKENEELILGAPWGTYSRRLLNSSYRIKKPVFGSYEDLEDIIEKTFCMYEDFKNILVLDNDVKWLNIK